VGDASPGSREAEDESGEELFIARSGRRADLLANAEGRGSRQREGGNVCRKVSLWWRLKSVVAWRQAPKLECGGKGAEKQPLRSQFDALLGSTLEALSGTMTGCYDFSSSHTSFWP
jgi:hypothetical protein